MRILPVNIVINRRIAIYLAAAATSSKFAKPRADSFAFFDVIFLSYPRKSVASLAVFWSKTLFDALLHARLLHGANDNATTAATIAATVAEIVAAKILHPYIQYLPLPLLPGSWPKPPSAEGNSERPNAHN